MIIQEVLIDRIRKQIYLEITWSYNAMRRNLQGARRLLERRRASKRKFADIRRMERALEEKYRNAIMDLNTRFSIDGKATMSLVQEVLYPNNLERF